MSAARFTGVAPLLLLLLLLLLLCRSLLYCADAFQFERKCGLEMFHVGMCSGWHAHIIRTHVHTEAPFVSVTKGIP